CLRGNNRPVTLRRRSGPEIADQPNCTMPVGMFCHGSIDRRPSQHEVAYRICKQLMQRVSDFVWPACTDEMCAIVEFVEELMVRVHAKLRGTGHCRLINPGSEDGLAESVLLVAQIKIATQDECNRRKVVIFHQCRRCQAAIAC